MSSMIESIVFLGSLATPVAGIVLVVKAVPKAAWGPRTKCWACGYDLSAHFRTAEAATCPECGDVVTREGLAELPPPESGRGVRGKVRWYLMIPGVLMLIGSPYLMVLSVAMISRW